MDILTFWGLFLLLVLTLFFGIPYLTYFIFKKLGKQKLGKILGLATLSVFVLLTIYAIFEDDFFFKSSARKELKKLDLVLKDDFQILKNESGGFNDYYHIFELKISDKDEKRLVGNENLNSKVLSIRHKFLESDGWIEVKIDTEKNILTYQYLN